MLEASASVPSDPIERETAHRTNRTSSNYNSDDSDAVSDHIPTTMFKKTKSGAYDVNYQLEQLVITVDVANEEITFDSAQLPFNRICPISAVGKGCNWRGKPALRKDQAKSQHTKYCQARPSAHLRFTAITMMVQENVAKGHGKSVIFDDCVKDQAFFNHLLKQSLSEWVDVAWSCTSNSGKSTQLRPIPMLTAWISHKAPLPIDFMGVDGWQFYKLFLSKSFETIQPPFWMLQKVREMCQQIRPFYSFPEKLYHSRQETSRCLVGSTYFNKLSVKIANQSMPALESEDEGDILEDKQILKTDGERKVSVLLSTIRCSLTNIMMLRFTGGQFG